MCVPQIGNDVNGYDVSPERLVQVTGWTRERQRLEEARLEAASAFMASGSHGNGLFEAHAQNGSIPRFVSATAFAAALFPAAPPPATVTAQPPARPQQAWEKAAPPGATVPPPEAASGDERVGQLALRVHPTPGHTPGSCCFLLAAPKPALDPCVCGAPGRMQCGRCHSTAR